MNIATNNLVKQYNGKKVLHLNDSHLFFEAGKIHGIIGANGSGKSTFMKILAGLIPASEGHVLYNGCPLSRQIQSEMTYSTHTPKLFSRSVFDNIAYPLAIRKHKRSDIAEKVEQLLDTFQISDIKKQSVRHLSGGEAQKTALARALSFSPKLLLLDEPTANIDPKSIQVIETALQKKNAEEKLTIIIVTHNLRQAFRLCHDLTFLDQGLCQFSGPPKKMMELDNPIIQSFISFN